MTLLSEVIQQLNKKHKANLISTDKFNVTFETKQLVPSPTVALSFLLHGDIPTQTMWEVYGQSGSGKSSLCEAIAGAFQKKYQHDYDTELEMLSSKEKLNKEEQKRLIELKQNGSRKVLWVDAENSMRDYRWCTLNGLDVDDIIYFRPDENTSAEQVFEDTVSLIKTGQICLVVIDSIAALTSAAALQKSIEEKVYCGISASLTTFCSKVLNLLAEFDTTIIGINQERATLNSMVPGATHTVGGAAYKFGCHIRLQLRRNKAIDEQFLEIPNKSETMYGQTSFISVQKNKVTKPDRRLSKFTITFDHGIYDFIDIINFAISLGIIQKAGAWLSFVDDKGDLYKASDDTDTKWQGLPKTIEYLKSHEDIYSLIKDKVMEYIVSP